MIVTPTGMNESEVSDMKMTSAYANKLIKKLNEDKDFWCNKERNSCTYTASIDEEPVIPEYDYAEVAGNIADIDEKIVKIKHAINVSNSTSVIAVGDKRMTIDEILVRMAQLGRRKAFLDSLRKREPKTRINSGFASRKVSPEYEYINYDLDLVKAEYDRIDVEIAAMQMALDKYNQTFEFEVDY